MKLTALEQRCRTLFSLLSKCPTVTVNHQTQEVRLPQTGITYTGEKGTTETLSGLHFCCDHTEFLPVSHEGGESLPWKMKESEYIKIIDGLEAFLSAN